MTRLLSPRAACLAFAFSALLTGCATSFNPATKIDPTQSSIGTISGAAHGGRQPIAGARIYLLEASTTGYGGAAYGPSSSNASTSLLDSATGNPPDSIGYYAVTDSNGAFSITGDYTSCTTGDQVYLYMLGGKPDGVNANSAAGLMAILGTCGSYSSSTTVNLNELSTIAAAYAMAGYATDATHVGSSATTLGKTGITNAFANAAQLFDTGSNPYGGPSSARTTTLGSGANGGTGTVPQKQIHTLANILATCVNSAGPTYSQCSSLFANGKSRLGATATDTASEAIFMAQNPGNTTVYNLAGTQPYTPYYNAPPGDLTIALTFTGGITRLGQDPSYQGSIAVDGLGNVWTLSYSTSTINGFDKAGVPLAGNPFTGNGVNRPNGVAVDINNRVWVANYAVNSDSHQSVSVFNNDGSAFANLYDGGTGCIVNDGNIAFDPSGNAWVTAVGGYNLCKIDPSGTSFTVVGSSLPNPSGIASDRNGNMWVTTNSGPQIDKFGPSGSNMNGSPFAATPVGANTFGVAVDRIGNAWVANSTTMLQISNTGAVGSTITGGGITQPSGVAVDGDNNVWEADFGTYGGMFADGDGAIVELNSSGNLLSGSQGYQSNTAFDGRGIAIDGSGNVWVDNFNANSIREIIGAAAPVVTPLSLAVKNNQLGTRP